MNFTTHSSKNTFVIALLLLFSMSALNAQCPTGLPLDILSFDTQEEIDQFKIDYPNCKDFIGGISIDIEKIVDPNGGTASANIDNLAGLSNLESISDWLWVRGDRTDINDPGLNDFSDLSNLEYVHRLHIDDMEHLQNLNGLTSLQTIDELFLDDNPSLTHLFNESQEINVTDFVEIQNNDVLSKLGNLKFDKEMTEITLHGDVLENCDDLLVNVSVIDNLNLSYPKLKLRSDLDLFVNDALVLFGEDLFTSMQGLNVGDSLKYLRLSGAHLTEGLESLLSLKSVDDLYLRYLSDISFVQNIKFINHFGLRDLPNIQNLDNFSSLETFGNLVFEDIPTLNDLSRLSTAEQIHADRSIFFIGPKAPIIDLNNLGITNLNGLSNLLDSLENFIIEENPNLQDFSGMDGAEYITKLAVLRNPALKELTGLEGLGEIGQKIEIHDNDALVNLDPLVNLEYIGRVNLSDFVIRNNASLNSMQGLRNLNGVIEDDFQIYNNPFLDFCDIDFVCSMLALDEASILIRDNGENCSSEEDIKKYCGINYLEIFLDVNSNGTPELEEPNVSVGSVNVGDVVKLYPNSNGSVGFFLTDNPLYIEYVPDEYWEVTTGNAYTAVPDLLSLPELIKVGVSPTEVIVNTEAYLSFTDFVCNRDYFITGTFVNTGTEVVDASMSFIPLGTYVDFGSVPTDTIDGIMFFDLGEVLPGQKVEKKVRFTAPGVMDIGVGDEVHFSLETEVIDQNGEIYTDQSEYETVLLCSYDPNDKQVFPAGEGEDNQTLFDEKEFQYLIRFQNTGNYPAQDVTIVDTLSENLDIRSFEFIAASHDVTRIKLEGKVLEFTFKNIFLPDSTSNEPDSHGFIQFKIDRLENLPEETVIENTANIYFDANPAIVTNTVKNTMVSEIISSTKEVLENARVLTLVPNPAHDMVEMRFKGQIVNDGWAIYDLLGQRVKSGYGSEINVSNLNAGSYIVRIKNETERLLVVN